MRHRLRTQLNASPTRRRVPRGAFAVHLSLLLVLVGLLLAACGGDGDRRATPPESATLAAGTLPQLNTGRDITAVDGRFTLRIPVGWVTTNDPVAELAFREESALSIRRFNVTREELGSIGEPLAYAEAARERIRSQLADVLTLSLDVVKAGERPGARWVYTARIDNETFLFYQFFLIDAGEGFVFTGVAPSTSSVEETRRYYDAIVGSFAFGRG